MELVCPSEGLQGRCVRVVCETNGNTLNWLILCLAVAALVGWEAEDVRMVNVLLVIYRSQNTSTEQLWA